MKSHRRSDDYVRALLKWSGLEGINDGASSFHQLIDRAHGVIFSTVKPSTFKELTRAYHSLKHAFKGFQRKPGNHFHHVLPATRGKRAGAAYPLIASRTWRRHFEAAGVVGLTWHDLRRTALQMREKEGGKKAAQQLATHASVVTTEGYLKGVGAAEVRPVRLDSRMASEF